MFVFGCLCLIEVFVLSVGRCCRRGLQWYLHRSAGDEDCTADGRSQTNTVRHCNKQHYTLGSLLDIYSKYHPLSLMHLVVSVPSPGFCSRYIKKR